MNVLGYCLVGLLVWALMRPEAMGELAARFVQGYRKQRGPIDPLDPATLRRDAE